MKSIVGCKTTASEWAKEMEIAKRTFDLIESLFYSDLLDSSTLAATADCFYKNASATDMHFKCWLSAQLGSAPQ